MRIVAVTNSRIPSLTANSIQAMKVCDALTQLGHAVILIAPQETAPARWDDLATHYGLKHEFEVRWRPSRKALRRFDFIWQAQADAGRLKPDLVYTWLPQSAAYASRLGYPVVLEMHADVAGRFGAWWLRTFWMARGPKRMLVTTRALKAALERSDVCVVESAGVVAESACALVLADAFLEKFGADSLSDIKKAYLNYKERIARA